MRPANGRRGSETASCGGGPCRAWPPRTCGRCWTVWPRPDADMSRVTVLVRGSGDLSIAALFAMVLDDRIKAAELDLAGACFENRKLPLVSCVLQQGDVLQWAACVTNRRLTLQGLAPEDGRHGLAAAGVRCRRQCRRVEYQVSVSPWSAVIHHRFWLDGATSCGSSDVKHSWLSISAPADLASVER